MENSQFELEERIKKLEEKAARTEEMLNLMIEYIDKKVEKKPMTFWTDGPIMTYGKNEIPWTEINNIDTEIRDFKNKFQTSRKKGADEPRGDEA